MKTINKFLLLFVSIILASCGGVQQQNIAISDIFLALPDSVMGSMQEKQLMLEGGDALDTIEEIWDGEKKIHLSYDVDKYPDGVALVKDKSLSLFFLHADGVWDMCYFDSQKSSNEKIVFIESCASVATMYLHTYQYFVDEKCFEPIATNINEVVKFEDLINKRLFSQGQLIKMSNAFKDAQHDWGNEMIFYDLSETNNSRIQLQLSSFILELAELSYNIDLEIAFPAVAYQWNGKAFEKASASADKFSAKDFYASRITEMEKIWQENDAMEAFEQEILPTECLLIDIDGDGVEELYLYNKANEEGALFCCGGEQLNLITHNTFKEYISVDGNKVKCGGSAGTGAVFYSGYLLRNSRVVEDFSYSESHWGDADGNEQEEIEYSGANEEEREYTRQFFKILNHPQTLEELGEWFDYQVLKGE